MATTISCAIDGADTRGMQVTLSCRGYGPTKFKAYGYVDDAGQINHDLWQFRGSRSSPAMEFLDEDESRIWVMAFDTGSSYPVTSNFFAAGFEQAIETTCYWPAIEINFTFLRGDQVLISLQLGQQSYTCSRTLKNSPQSRGTTATYPSSSSSREDPATFRRQKKHEGRQSLLLARVNDLSPSMDEETFLNAPRLYKMVPLPSCSKSIDERGDMLEEHKDKLKDWLSDDQKSKYHKIWGQKTLQLPSWTSRDLESAEILMKFSRMSVPGQVCCCLEGGSCANSPGASDKGDLKHPGTSSTDIMIWVDQVNEVARPTSEPCRD